MRLRLRPQFFAALAFFGLAAPVFPAGPVQTAVRIEQAPRLDGNLDDEVWRQGAVFSDFRMVFPAMGDPSEKTELRILHDHDSLYIGVYCYDSEPSKIAANSMAHDGDEEGHAEDVVKILLDPFQNKRNAYVFSVNARAARSEGLAFGEHSSLNWDGIWDARSRIQPDGWSTEIRIPFKTISFTPGLDAWGINVERYIARKQETIRLSGVRQDNFFNNPAEATELRGIDNLKLGTGITFKPYGAARAQRGPLELDGTDYQWDGGFDIYKNFTPNFIGAFSYNTDFAETEVDERRINLTRFPLYFPEKRTFFLEGSEIYNFGTTSGGGVDQHAGFTPFFSRRIGLYEGHQIPIIFGTKVFGRLGNTNLALLDVMTEDAFRLPKQNFVAGRLYQSVLSESKVGLIFTDGSPTGERNLLAGFDLIYQTSRFRGNQNFSAGGWYVYNWNSRESGKHQGYGFKLDYPNDLWDIMTSYGYYGDALDPGIGFLPRNNVQTYSLMLSYQPRPEKGFIGRLVRQFFYELMFDFYWDLSGRLETRSIFLAPLNFQTESGEHIEFNISPTRDVLPYDFEVSEGVIIPKGAYDYVSYQVEVGTASHRPVSANIEQRFGSFYSGHLDQTELGLVLKYKGYATFDFRADIARGRLPEGNFNEVVYELKADFYFSPRLGLMNYFQYDDASNQLGINTRFRWEIRPGNIIYFVYTKDWERRWDPMSRFVPLAERGVFKIQLSIRP
jgi:Carbohydrate family 9 binding domain-like/Domain of unknown function (DUF5916)